MPKVEIGRLFTGKREMQYDSRTGQFSVSLPAIEGDDLKLMQAFTPKLRTKPEVRTPGLDFKKGVVLHNSEGEVIFQSKAAAA